MNPPSFEPLLAALPDLKARFDMIIPAMKTCAHRKPRFISASVHPVACDPLYENYIAMIHVIVEETRLVPHEMGLRYLVSADGGIVRQRELTGDYHKSDAASSYMQIVDDWCKAAMG